MQDPVPRAGRTHMEHAIRTYFAGCNKADHDQICRFLAPDAVHYFPAGSPFGTFEGADGIARGWIECVRLWDSRWTVDRMVIDTESNEAVIEWTHFQPGRASYLRGDEWYLFDNDGLIREIRAYYACPIARDSPAHELGGFPYQYRGYAMAPPEVHRAP